MAFNMYAGQLHETIGGHEEFIFAHTGVCEEKFPTLSFIWAEFYNDPRITPAQANLLVHELIDLFAQDSGKNKALSSLVFKLVVFFSAAYRGDREIKCASD